MQINIVHGGGGGGNGELVTASQRETKLISEMNYPFTFQLIFGKDYSFHQIREMGPKDFRDVTDTQRHLSSTCPPPKNPLTVFHNTLSSLQGQRYYVNLKLMLPSTIWQFLTPVDVTKYN